MGSTCRTRWRSAPTGRASTSPRTRATPWPALPAPTTGAITQPAGTAGCVSETGAGPCADGHGARRRVLGGGQRRREERLRRLEPRRRRGPLYPQHDHRGDHPARRHRRLRERDGGGPLRRRPGARRRELGGGQPRRQERLRRREQRTTTPRPWLALSATRPPGRSPSLPGDRRLRERDGGGAVRRRQGARRPGLGVGQPRREERLRRRSRLFSTAWLALSATRPPGRSPSPPRRPPAA